MAAGGGVGVPDALTCDAVGLLLGSELTSFVDTLPRDRMAAVVDAVGGGGDDEDEEKEGGGGGGGGSGSGGGGGGGGGAEGGGDAKRKAKKARAS
jgi:hypothetical protein